MFERILIANRGEIACRIIRTCRRLGIHTVGVYSEVDAQARHVTLCDEAFYLGGASAQQSYLNAERILDIARQSGAQALHPGYGFLSENARFADACAAAGITFIGPPPAAIRAMGSKSAAKATLAPAGVPLVPGYHGEEQGLERLAAEAEAVGYPVLIKASAGGGGKGMRRVDDPAAFAQALAAAQREALAAFGDERMLIEKYLIEPRHIEIQIFADSHGNAIHLFERDCSIQRRHQKIIEEAPAPGLSAELRQAMGEAAVAAARAIGYVNAGTVEFIVADGAFYFMEMNTRLQVEHPVTELVTGQDLVEWQLRVASGEPLPLGQEALALRGHAFEARIYAEDPQREFLPASGRLHYLQAPPASAHVRIDSGVQQGDEITIHYDPMIAKLIVWDQSRPLALRRLRMALAHYRVVGPATNLALLAAIAHHPSFAAGEVSTHFIAQHGELLGASEQPITPSLLAAATLCELSHVAAAARRRAEGSLDPYSPWQSCDGWRLNGESYYELHFRCGDDDYTVIAHQRWERYDLEIDGQRLDAAGQWLAGDELLVEVDGRRERLTAVRCRDTWHLFTQTGRLAIAVRDPLLLEQQIEGAGSTIAPMPGTITQQFVAVGERVAVNAPLLVLEAMKMEHTVRAPQAGRVVALHAEVGAQVSEGTVLAQIEAEEGEGDV